MPHVTVIITAVIIIVVFYVNLAVPVRAPEVQMHFPHPNRQVAHITLKMSGNVFTKRVLGHASFPVATAMGPNRREFGIGLTSFNGAAAGKISLRVRVAEMGVLIEDWVALGQGMRSFAEVPAVKAAHGVPPGVLPHRRRRLASLGLGSPADAMVIGGKVNTGAPLRLDRRKSLLGADNNVVIAKVNPLMLQEAPVGEAKAYEPAADDFVMEHRDSAAAAAFFSNPMQSVVEASRTLNERRKDKAMERHLGLMDDVTEADVSGDCVASLQLPNQPVPSTPSTPAPIQHEHSSRVLTSATPEMVRRTSFTDTK